MPNVTISKREYQRLVDKTLRYEYLRQILQEDIFSPPVIRDIKTIIKEFRGTGRYNKSFLENLAKGLKRSSHFK